MGQRARILMCAADHFAVRYVINPWMEGNIDRVSAADAARQWRALHGLLKEHAEVELIPPHPDLPDMVFTANAGVALDGKVLLSRFTHEQRRAEEPLYREWFEAAHFEVTLLPDDLAFEGAGDALLDGGAPRLWAGYGFRTALESHVRLAEHFDVEVVSLKLIDPRFYHLDTCLCPLKNGFLLCYPPAFDARSQRRIRDLVPPEKFISIPEADAVNFACNAVNIDDAVVLHQASPSLRARLEEAGFSVIATPLDQFQKSGGSAKCLTLRLDETVPPRPAGESVGVGVQQGCVELRGHLLDDGILTRALDATVESGASFRVQEFELGSQRTQPSRARIQITAPTAAVMDEVQGLLLPLGARPVAAAPDEVALRPVEMAGVAPDDFYATTIYPTDVRLHGHWVRVARQRMDAVIVVDPARRAAECRLLRDLQPGEMVVTGANGIRAAAGTKAKRGDSDDSFTFMGSGVSSERRVETAVEQIAWEMRRIRERQGRIVVVAGPVVVHTGGGTHLAQLIRAGYVQALLGGNAIAVHDLEQAVMGTSLGVDLARGVPVRGGHRHHLRVINLIRRHGSIAEAVRAGAIRSGIMYECVQAGVPYSLAGSIRDDGPLPDTEMDLIRAQADYARLVRGADMILMLASMLHSIGTGNMTPAGVKLVCVDINPAVVTKLADRGSLESIGIVTDSGLFLSRLVQQLTAESLSA